MSRPYDSLSPLPFSLSLVRVCVCVRVRHLVLQLRSLELRGSKPFLSFFLSFSASLSPCLFRLLRGGRKRKDVRNERRTGVCCVGLDCFCCPRKQLVDLLKAPPLSELYTVLS